MLGKRSRSIRGVMSVVSMGLECPPGDNWQIVDKQNSSPRAPRQIVGFDLKISLEREETKSFPVTSPVDKQGGSPKSYRPTSGLEGLLSSPRPASIVNKNLQPVGLSFVAALDSCLESPCEGKSLVTDCRSRAPGVALRCIAHISETQKIHCCAAGNTCKRSNPIPIAQSLSPQPLDALHNSRHQNPNQSVNKDPRKCSKGVHSGVDAKRCIFSLLTTSPGTYEGAEHVFFCPMDFMNACFLCKRHLGQGRDIYMYRGDKAFCSIECRHQQIVSDERAERREKCSSIALKAGTVVQSLRSNQRTGVVAAGTAAAA